MDTITPTEDEPEEVDYGDPGQEVGAAGPSFVPALANVLSHMASLSGRPQRATRFHAIRPPQLSICDYLSRISTYFQCSHECFVLGLVYIDRIVKLHPEFTICHLNIHRLLVTSIMLSAKFFDDVYYSNSYYAKVGGVRTQELNALEAQFLVLIQWKLHVLPQEYDQYRNHVLMAVRGAGASTVGLGIYRQPSTDPPSDHEEAVESSRPENIAAYGAAVVSAPSLHSGLHIMEGTNALEVGNQASTMALA
jgi:hypothetical protein|mmetsp:Transcript_67931/g.106164  ORF Transcript_67931/g.106164 Transcript_67931/m.106164 type:complete len:250 (+) Transcript_67931:156-905(+)